MTYAFLLIAMGFIAVALYCLRLGRGFKAGIKVLGASFFFETSETNTRQKAAKLLAPDVSKSRQ
jgi:hypothetical protein